MGFLDFLKGKKDQIPKEKPKIIADLAEISNLLSNNRLTTENEMKERLFPKFAEIKHLLKEIRTELDEVELSEDKPTHDNERIKKMAITSKAGFVAQMNSLLEKLQPPQTSVLSEIEKYSSTSAGLMNKEIVRFRKNIVLTGFVAKEPVKRIGQYISELSATLNTISEENSLQNASDSVKAINLISEINELLDSVKDTESRINESELEKTKINLKINSEKIELNSLKNSDEYSRAEKLTQTLAENETKKNQISQKAMAVIAPVEKPMHRLLKVSSYRGTLTTDEWQIITLYLESPLDAIKKDPKAEILKSILTLLKENINNGTVSLKEKEIPKKLAAITSLQETDLFGELFWNLNDIEAKINSIKKELSGIDIIQKINLSSENIDNLRSQAEAITDSVKKKKLELQSKKETLSDLKTDLENHASRVLNSSVEITIPALS